MNKKNHSQALLTALINSFILSSNKTKSSSLTLKLKVCLIWFCLSSGSKWLIHNSVMLPVGSRCIMDDISSAIFSFCPSAPLHKVITKYLFMLFFSFTILSPNDLQNVFAGLFMTNRHGMP